MTFVLASSSPRRLTILKELGIVPDYIAPADLDESRKKGEQHATLALRLALEKARAIAPIYPDAYVLGADTVVACGTKLLAKAEDKAQVSTFLSQLSGRRHHVYTGVALVTPHGKCFHRLSKSWVRFKKMDDAEIQAYAASGEGEGKAGGYAVQGRAALFIKEICGSYTGIVGLPVYETGLLLKQTGWTP